MADFPLGDHFFIEVAGVDTSTSSGTAVTSGNGVKGSWTEIIASTSSNSTFLILEFNESLAGVLRDFLIDIGVGAAASEQVLVADIQQQSKSDFNNGQFFYIPVQLASGTRLSIRTQTNSAATDARFIIYLFSGTFQSSSGYAKTTAYGLSGEDGTAVDPGGTANTKGSWTEITASTSERINEMTILVSGNTNGAQANGTALYDVAIGGSGSEVIILENLYAASSSFEVSKASINIKQKIPAGTRIAIRMQSTITDATDRVFSFSVNGVS